MDYAIPITLLCTLISVSVGYLSYQRGRAKESRKEGENTGTLLSDIGYIKAGVDDLKKEQKEQGVAVHSISERLTRNEESTKQAHKRIDEIIGGNK